MAVRLSKGVMQVDGSKKAFSVKAGRGGYIALGWKKDSLSMPVDWRLCHEGMPKPTRASARKDGQEWCEE